MSLLFEINILKKRSNVRIHDYVEITSDGRMGAREGGDCKFVPEGSSYIPDGNDFAEYFGFGIVLCDHNGRPLKAYGLNGAGRYSDAHLYIQPGDVRVYLIHSANETYVRISRISRLKRDDVLPDSYATMYVDDLHVWRGPRADLLQWAQENVELKFLPAIQAAIQKASTEYPNSAPVFYKK